jgi:hypothetical protein
MIIIWLIFLGLEFCFGLKKTIYACQFLIISRILIPETVRLTPIADISYIFRTIPTHLSGFNVAS